MKEGRDRVPFSIAADRIVRTSVSGTWLFVDAARLLNMLANLLPEDVSSSGWANREQHAIARDEFEDLDTTDRTNLHILIAHGIDGKEFVYFAIRICPTAGLPKKRY